MPTVDATNLSFLRPLFLLPPSPSVAHKRNELEKRASHHSGQFGQQSRAAPFSEEGSKTDAAGHAAEEEKEEGTTRDEERTTPIFGK